MRGAEDKLAGLAQAQRHAVDAVDRRQRLSKAGDGTEAAEALYDDLGHHGITGGRRCAGGRLGGVGCDGSGRLSSRGLGRRGLGRGLIGCRCLGGSLRGVGLGLGLDRCLGLVG